MFRLNFSECFPVASGHFAQANDQPTGALQLHLPDSWSESMEMCALRRQSCGEGVTGSF